MRKHIHPITDYSHLTFKPCTFYKKSKKVDGFEILKESHRSGRRKNLRGAYNLLIDLLKNTDQQVKISETTLERLSRYEQEKYKRAYSPGVKRTSIKDLLDGRILEYIQDNPNPNARFHYMYEIPTP